MFVPKYNRMLHKTYFISDLHLGLDTPHMSSKKRELLVCEWLRTIEDGASIYFLGDIFDYWYEYKNVIPVGYSDFFAELKQAINRDIHIEFFSGNHDMWMFSYFDKEYGIPVHHNPKTIEIGSKTLYLGHGDGLGPGDNSYKRVKRLFRSKWAQRAFYILHPDLALSIMKKVSQRSEKEDHPYNQPQEMLIKYCNKKNIDWDIDYYIFGHRHIVVDHLLENKISRYINLGDWISYFSYAVFSNDQLELRFFKENHPICG